MPRHLLATLLLILPMTASADTLYRWHDAHGTHYSDTPPTHKKYRTQHLARSVPPPPPKVVPVSPDAATWIRYNALYGSHDWND